jgi:RNA-binding protein 26
MQTPPVSQRFEIHKGPNHTDRSNTTLVVEGIPPGPSSPLKYPRANIVDKFNEPTIRGWFSQFGPLNQVIIDHTWVKAILVYADYDSAAKAWNDPRPVFSNRFVKIWWKKTSYTTPPPPNSGSSSSATGLSGEIVDQVELEIARETAKKAQREHEEKQRRKEELEKKKEELEKQRLELVELQRGAREKLMEKIRRAEEKAKEKAREIVAAASASPEQTQKNNESVTPTAPAQSPEKETTNGTSVPEQEPSERKAQLQKMLTDLQNQVPPSHPHL